MNSYIILAAGIGRNMKGVGCKSLLKINGSYLIDIQISTILKNDEKADIIIVGGFEYQKLLNHIGNSKRDIRIVYNHQFDTTGQSESLKIGINCCRKSNLTVIHGDILFKDNSICFPNKKNSWMTISDKVNNNAVGTIIQDGLIENISYGIDNKWGQIVYFPESKFQEVKRIINSTKGNRLTYEIINKLNFDIYAHCDDSVEIDRNTYK